MRKNIIFVALLVVLTGMAVSCQKENLVEPQTSIAEKGTVSRCSTPLTAYCTLRLSIMMPRSRLYAVSVVPLTRGLYGSLLRRRRLFPLRGDKRHAGAYHHQRSQCRFLVAPKNPRRLSGVRNLQLRYWRICVYSHQISQVN